MNKQVAKNIIILMEGALDDIEQYCDDLDLECFTDSEVDFTTDIREKLELISSDISYIKDELEE
jgi:uncharacterized protein with HEPN domain